MKRSVVVVFIDEQFVTVDGWRALSDYPTLGDVVDLHRGIEYRAHETESVQSDTAHPGFQRGILRVKDSQFRPYQVGRVHYIKTSPESIRRGGDLDWRQPKVLMNDARLSRGLWPIAAAPDHKGLIFSHNFIGLWPRSLDTPIEVLAALLNGPVASAFVSDKQPTAFNRRRLRLDQLATVPIPRLSPRAKETIVTLVHRVQSILQRGRTVDRSLWLSLDAKQEVLRAYDLPPSMETRLLQWFDQSKRPGVSSLWSYYDGPVTCAMPLFSWVDGQMDRAEVGATMDRVTVIDDPRARDWAEQWMGSRE